MVLSRRKRWRRSSREAFSSQLSAFRVQLTTVSIQLSARLVLLTPDKLTADNLTADC